MTLGGARHPYGTQAYAETLRHVGTPLDVPEWGSNVIVRTIDSRRADAMGTYPLCCLDEAADVGAGLERLRGHSLLTATLVVDGLSGPRPEDIAPHFDLHRAYKTHYLVDPSIGPYRPTRHHAQEIRRAARRDLDVRFVPFVDILGPWCTLYAHLVERRAVGALQQFPAEAFHALCRCDGLHAVAAFLQEELVCCHLWIEHGNTVWSHLAASSPEGYDTGAAYLVYDVALRRFAGRLVSLGGSAGQVDVADDGLARFKSGFSNTTGTSYLLGTVLDRLEYAAVCSDSANVGSYFPAYRGKPLQEAPGDHQG
jgi:hypothetical protein